MSADSGDVATGTGTDTTNDAPESGDTVDLADSSGDVFDGADPDTGDPDGQSDTPEQVDVPGYPECIETPCPTGYECFTQGCLPVVAEGENCVAGLNCERGTTCVLRADDQRCLRDGTEGGYCRFGAGHPEYQCAVAPVCDAGLACDLSLDSRGNCRPGLPLGALCGAYGDLCNEDAGCVPVLGTRRCVADGEPGGQCVVSPDGLPEVADSCSEGLSCSEGFAECTLKIDRCLREVAVDGSCAAAHTQCPGDQECVTLPTGAFCRSPGVFGAPCRHSGDPCDEGLVCRPDLLDSDLFCMEEAQVGESCGIERERIACAEGLSCTAEQVYDAGICLAPGTGAGAACRIEEPRCDDDLLCSDFSRYRQTCRVQAEAGDACDLAGLQVVCPAGTQCLPLSYDETGLAMASCVSTIAEEEPNPIATPSTDATPSMVVFDADLLVDDAEDCFSVLLGEREVLFIEMSQTTTLFTASSTIRLWNSEGEELGRWGTFPSSTPGPITQTFRLEPNAIPLLRTLSPDTYTVCVEPETGVVGDYRMGISAADIRE